MMMDGVKPLPHVALTFEPVPFPKHQQPQHTDIVNKCGGPYIYSTIWQDLMPAIELQVFSYEVCILDRREAQWVYHFATLFSMLLRLHKIQLRIYIVKPLAIQS